MGESDKLMILFFFFQNEDIIGWVHVFLTMKLGFIELIAWIVENSDYDVSAHVELLNQGARDHGFFFEGTVCNLKSWTWKWGVHEPAYKKTLRDTKYFRVIIIYWTFSLGAWTSFQARSTAPINFIMLAS